ncbi:class I SAM-dependent methyltransferase [Paenibacillus crassostreae]|uniref:SAM-dependent methyltransferase n=1 Tax=Paenibacillus crassostreae TaxID=1763538 RepID=A0A162N7R2_9BACL|nr:class I SAM-dependent methyltransferase [Paenibacillus crassostreae]AOZ93717.1 SAM-dependent methyltransferase [Paenibacillus crassostreae]OAB71252.1 SAM-dependent methyltransferase [Paenibacillus crassostreae]
MIEEIRNNNVARFAGFGTLYDQNRPSAPPEIVDILTTYLRSVPHTVVDVGCGTGLSSFIWLNHANRIIGFEPSDDMRQVALSKWEVIGKPSILQFENRLSHDLGLPAHSVDILTCSQSFHWMEPHSTLCEFARVLRPGGIFAAYDCDWPPAFDWTIEERYQQLISSADALASQLAPREQQPHKWNKDRHLQNIQDSGLFRFAKEIVFHHWESLNAERYVNLALSQGGLQTALKLGAVELHSEIAQFRDDVSLTFAGESRNILFSYRMRIGIV